MESVVATPAKATSNETSAPPKPAIAPKPAQSPQQPAATRDTSAPQPDNATAESDGHHRSKRSTESSQPETPPSSSNDSNTPTADKGLTHDEASRLLNQTGSSLIESGNRSLSEKLAAGSEQSFTGYPSDFLINHQTLDAISEHTQQLSPPRKHFYDAQAATVSSAFENEHDPAARAALSGLQNQLLDTVTNEAATHGSTPEGAVMSLFNTPPGTGLLAKDGEPERQKMSVLWQMFRNGSPETRQQVVSKAIQFNYDLQQQIYPLVDAQTQSQNVAWNDAYKNADQIMSEAGKIDDPAKRYESIGRKLFSLRMSDNPQKTRDMLAFTERMKSPDVASKLNQWHADAGGPLNAEGVGAPKRYTDILKNLPETADRYVDNLADSYNDVLQDASTKDYSITPQAKAARIASQIFEGIDRFALGLLPMGDRILSDKHSSLNLETRVGIGWASAIAGLALPFGEANEATKAAAIADKTGETTADVSKTGESIVESTSKTVVDLNKTDHAIEGPPASTISGTPRLPTFDEAAAASPALEESEPLRLRGGGILQKLKRNRTSKKAPQSPADPNGPDSMPDTSKWSAKKWEKFLTQRTKEANERAAVEQNARAGAPQPARPDSYKDVIQSWGKPSSNLDADVDRLLAHRAQSNADDYPAIADYAEAGDGEINTELRGRGPLSADTREFLDQLDQLNDYKGSSIRVTQVTDDGIASLRQGTGQVFSDSGVQSSSIVPQNAAEWTGWSKEQATAGKRELVMIFDETVPQKNLANSEFTDHVAVPPGTRLKLVSLQNDGQRYFAIFTKASEQDGRARSPYDGKYAA